MLQQVQLQQLGMMMPLPPTAPLASPSAPPLIGVNGAGSSQNGSHGGNGVYVADISDDKYYAPGEDSGSEAEELEYDKCEPRSENKTFCTFCTIPADGLPDPG